MAGIGKSDGVPGGRAQPELSPEYLAALAHELRNPLAPIRNSAELLRSICSDPRQIQAVEMIVRQVVHLTRMLDDVLDATQLRRGLVSLTKQSVDVAAIADQALEAIRPAIDARRQSLLVSLPAESLQMLCDPVRLVQVLQNLLDNASRYTAEGGAISLEVAVRGERLVMEVADNGAGIDPEVLPRLFNVYAQTPTPQARPKGGLGLGLVIARNLVEMHGGTITAESAGVGQGARFTVKLPLEGNPVDSASGEKVTTPTSGTMHRVLIIDDQEDVGVSLASFLSAKGYAVATAKTGEAGVAAAREFKPDAAIIDIGLPGMDGFDVARVLRTMPECAAALLIAVSGYSMKTFRASEAYLAFRHYLLKPTNPATILAILERTLKARGRVG
jgi:CheY-like chemotaxis protein/two-component sensor histidine kinase